MNSNMLLSIIMPVYNAEKYLLNMISNVRNQTYTSWELIIVDDCSTDHSGEICDSEALLDDRIKVIHLAQNQGAGNARNQGMKCAQGAYITFIDADDEIDLNLYENAIQKVDLCNADVVIWGVREEYYDKTERKAYENIIVAPSCYANSPTDVHNLILELEQNTLLGYQWNKIYKTKLIRENNILFKDTILYEDYFFNIEFMKYVTSICVLEQALYHYKKRQNDSITTKYIKEYYKLSYQRVKTMLLMCKEWEMDLCSYQDILGQIYVRYILSALMRKNDPNGYMKMKMQKQWLERVRNDSLYNQIGYSSNISNTQLKVFQILLNKQCYSICVLLGKAVWLVKSGNPLLFSLIKRHKRRRHIE